MTDTSQPFVLRADGLLHLADVRCVTYCHGETIASASRDQSAQVISLHHNAILDAEDRDELVRGLPITGHTAFVNFILYHPGLPLLDGAPCLITGSNDHHVAIWHFASDLGSTATSCTLEAVLDGHAQGVCAGTYVTLDDVQADGHMDLVTVDWAGVCIVFDALRGRPKQLYTKHATAVRGVAHLPHTTFMVTCSGDKTIHQWDLRTGQTIRVFQGHEDVVQCICAIDQTTFATGSNDCTVRVWKATDPSSTAASVSKEEACVVLKGHSSLVYTVAWHAATQELLTSSEDRTVCVWGRAPAAERKEPFFLRQAVHHPCVVWSVAGISDGGAKGDILTGGADGVVRVWTRNDRFMASVEKLERLEQSVASQQMDVKVAHAAGLDPAQIVPMHELHTQRGAHEGDRRFVRNEAGTIELYTWSGGRWEKIGDVVAGPSQTPYTGVALPKDKQYWNGKAYDYLFDVDVQGAMLKLPYNAGDSILETARQFISDHPAHVSIDNLEAIQQFLLAHIDPADLIKVPGLEHHTAASPDLAAAAASASTTGPSVHHTPASSEAPMPVVWTDTEVFMSFNLEGAQKKVSEALAGQPNSSMSVDEANELLRRVDEAARAGASSPAAIAALADLCTELSRLFSQLPVGTRFPAVDALRYLIVKAQLVCLVDVVLQNTSELLAASAAASVDASSTGAVGLAASDTESLVWMRLAVCAAAVLAATPHTMPASAADWLSNPQTSPAMLYLFDTLPRANARTTVVSIKSALSALMQNEVVLAKRLASCSGGMAPAMPTVQWLLTHSLMPVVAQRLTCEPVGAPVVVHDLTTLWTLFGADHSGTSDPSSWLSEAKKVGRALLTLPLQALETGADPRARPVARALQKLLAS